MSGKITMVGQGLALIGSSMLLAGCGGGDTATTTVKPAPPGSSSTQEPSTQEPSTQVPSTHESTQGPSTTTTPADPRTPLYVALRMDDISVGELEDVQADILNWFSVNRVPFNFHVITGSEDGDWPTECKTNPLSSEFCASPIVRKLQEVYDAGQILGTSDDAWLSLGCHSHDHDYWPTHIHGHNTDSDWQHEDIAHSMGLLRATYPNASITSFAAPANAANNGTVQACLAQGLNIVTTQATVNCNAAEEPGTAPNWNYGFAPCGSAGDYTDMSSYAYDCIPPDDTYYTAEGIQLANGVYSLPCSSANSNFQTVEIGLSVDDTIGISQCGCVNNVCPMVANAKEMADKSNGLHWTVLIMHPQTAFDGQTWPEWLDEFLQKTRALEEYNVKFLTMAQMTELHAAASTQTLIV